MHYFELSSDFETFHSRKNNRVPLLQAQLLYFELETMNGCRYFIDNVQNKVKWFGLGTQMRAHMKVLTYLQILTLSKKNMKKITSHKDIHRVPGIGIESRNHGLYDRGVSDHFHC